MAVQHANSVIVYDGNDSDAEAYPIPFRFLSTSEIKVTVKPPDASEPEFLFEGQDYSLTVFRDNNNVISGGEVVTDIPYNVSTLIFIYRQVDLTQLTELPEFGPFPANTLEQSLDKAVMALQQQDRAIRRCFRVSDYSAELTPPYPVPNTVLGISADNDLRLFNGADLLSLIQLPGSLLNAPTAYWLNDFDRPLKVPDFVGQVGLQMDDNALYHATGAGAGDWTAVVLDEDDMASNNAKMPPSQQSVKAYVDGIIALFEGYADTVVATAETNANLYTDGEIAAIEANSTTLCRFTPRDNQPPAANWARASTRNSISKLNFSDSVTETAVFLSTVLQGLSFASLQVILHWAATSATSGDVVWNAAIERMNTDMDSDSFATAGTATGTANATSGVMTTTTINVATTDGLQPGDPFRLKITRDTAAGGDTMTGDAEVIAVEVRRVL